MVWSRKGVEASLGAHKTILQVVLFLSAVATCTSNTGDNLCALDLNLASVGWDVECGIASPSACNLDGFDCHTGALYLDNKGLAGTLDKDWNTISSLSIL